MSLQDAASLAYDEQDDAMASWPERLLDAFATAMALADERYAARLRREQIADRQVRRNLNDAFPDEEDSL